MGDIKVNFVLACHCIIVGPAADDSVPAKILSYNRANRAVAILCNHQRAPPKTFEKSMQNLQTKVNHPGLSHSHMHLILKYKDWRSVISADCCQFGVVAD